METAFRRIAEPRIVYDEGGVIVAAKPAGMHCAPAAEPGTLCSWLFSRRPEAALVGGRGKGEGGLLHRLDQATSGLVAFAADDGAFAVLSAAGRDGTFVKTYRALGSPAAAGLAGSRPESAFPAGADGREWLACLRRGDSARLAAMLSGAAVLSRFRPYGPGAARVACADPGGAAAAGGKSGKDWTRDVYRTDIVSAVASEGGVLAEAVLTRGFRHQIRAHMAWLGLPLQGDAVYGDGAGPLRLQAFRLSFPSPVNLGTVVVDLDLSELGNGA